MEKEDIIKIAVLEFYSNLTDKTKYVKKTETIQQEQMKQNPNINKSDVQELNGGDVSKTVMVLEDSDNLILY